MNLKTAVTMAEGFMKAARENFERSGFLVPVVFVFLSAEKVMLLTPDSLKIPFDDSRGKDLFAAIVREACMRFKAVAVLQIFEAWHAGAEALEWAKTHDSLEHCPGRKEALFATLEHATLAGSMGWTAEIRREGPKPTTDEFQAMPPNMKSEGRFVGFLSEHDLSS
jgi:hypothetical protein